MTQDQFNSDNQMDLSSMEEEGGDFRDLDLGTPAPRKAPSRVPFFMMLLVAVGGVCIVAWQIFLGGSVPDRPIDVAPPSVTPAEQTAENLPPSVTPAETPTDPNNMDVASLVDKAAVADVTAPPTETSALPEPTAPVVDETVPPEAQITAPISSPEIVEETPPVEAAKVEEPVQVAQAETPPAPTPAPAAPVVAETPAAPVVAEAPPAPVMPAPAKEQLQPVEPPAPVAEVKTPAAKNAEAADAVKEILGKDAIVTPDVRVAQEKAMMAPAEVTPRAKQVIIVKKAYAGTSPQAMIAAGDRVMDAGQYNDAATLYDRQLKNNPSDPLALAGMALALQRAGRTDEAIKVYDRLLQLNPRDLDALTNSLGLLQQQDPQKAIGRLQSLEQQYPENAAVAAQLAMAEARIMDTPNALRGFQKAMALDSTNPTYPFNMGVLYDRLGNSDKAREHYHRALDVANAYPDRASGVPMDIIRQRLQMMN